MARQPNYFYGGTGARGQLNPGPWAAAVSSLGQALFGDQAEVERRSNYAQEQRLREAQTDKILLENKIAQDQAAADAAFTTQLSDALKLRGQPVTPEADTPLVAPFTETPKLETASAMPPTPQPVGYGFDDALPDAPDLARNDIALPPNVPLSEIALDQPPQDAGVTSLQDTMTAEPAASGKPAPITDMRSLINSLDDLEIMRLDMAPASKKRETLDAILVEKSKNKAAAAKEASADGAIGATLDERDDWRIANLPPDHPSYGQAWFRKYGQPTYREKVWVDEEGEHRELIPFYNPPPPGIQPPTGRAAAAASVQQNVAQTQDAPPAPGGEGAPGETAPSTGGGGGGNLGTKKAQLAGEVAPRAGALAAAQTDADILEGLIVKPDGTIDSSVLWASTPEIDIPMTNIKIRGVGKGAQARAAIEGMTDAIIRPLTGAAVNQTEFPRYTTIFVPQPTDSDVLVMQKLRRYRIWSAAIQRAQETKMVPTAEWLAAKRDEIYAQLPDPPEMKRPLPQPQPVPQPTAPQDGGGGGQNWILDDSGELVPQ